MYRKIIILILVSCPGVASSEEKPFWPHGSMVYTNKSTWIKYCHNFKRYRIGEDIVGCVTKMPDGKPNDLIMGYANDFTKSELGKMLDSTLNPNLPLRNHSRFKCLRVTSGWQC